MIEFCDVKVSFDVSCVCLLNFLLYVFISFFFIVYDKISTNAGDNVFRIFGKNVAKICVIYYSFQKSRFLSFNILF